MATTFQVAKNRAKSALAADITDIATSLTVTADEGTNFPSTYPFPITIEDEILKCTNRDTDTLTVERAQEGTSAVAHVAGKAVHLRITAKFASDLHTAVNAIENKADIGARAYHDAAQSIADTTWVALALNSERYDTDGIHDLATNNSRLTCKTAGKYIIVANIAFASNTTGRRMVGIFLNGATFIGVGETNATTTGSCIVTVATIYLLEVNDYVEMKAFQNSGGALNVVAAANYSPEFMMHRLP